MGETITSSFDQEKPVRELEFAEWIELGLLRGWAFEPVCQTHDGVQMYPEEEQEFEDGSDPCIPVMRLRDDD